MQKSLVSNLSDAIESKNLTIDERNLTSTQWVEYHAGTKRKSYNSLPTSDITAEAVTVGGFTLSQTDNAGVTTTGTRSLTIQKDDIWYTYGWDLTKNICELYGTNGYIRTAYTYSPYGEVTESANGVYQPIQWSSEYNDTELDLVYYNYRHYNPLDGRWLGRDRIPQRNQYGYCYNEPLSIYDTNGLSCTKSEDRKIIVKDEYFLKERADSFLVSYAKDSVFSTQINVYINNKIHKAADEINKKKVDRCGNACYQVDVYTNSLSLLGINSLPWRGYDMAFLLSHSSIENNGEAVADTGIYPDINSETVKIPIKNFKNVKVYGCHLSGKPGGSLSKPTVADKLVDDLKRLPVKNICKKKTYIQIVSAKSNTFHCVFDDN